MGKFKDARKKILQAAFEEIHLYSYHGSNVNRIANKSGVTKGAMYYYFKTKTDLGYAVVDEVIQRVVKETWFRPLEKCDDPIKCLQQIIRRSIRETTVEDIRLGMPLIDLSLEMSPLDEGFRKRFNLIQNNWLKIVTNSFTQGQKAGTVCDKIVARKSATQILAFLIGSITLAKSTQSLKLFRDCQRRLIEHLILHPISDRLFEPPPI